MKSRNIFSILTIYLDTKKLKKNIKIMLKLFKKNNKLFKNQKKIKNN